MRSQTGLTLIELMVVLVVLGVAAAVAVPAFNSLVRNVWASGRANELVAAFTTARSEAINRGGTVTVCASDNPLAGNPGCNNNRSNGWIVFDDADNDQAVDGGETVIRVWQGMEEGVALTEVNNLNAVTYGSRGGASQTMAFDLEPADASNCTGNSSHRISVTPVGRTDVQRQNC